MSHGEDGEQVDDGHKDADSKKLAPIERKPRLLLMGLKRSGKSSISNVVFRKMPPQDTLFLPTTTAILKESMHTFMDFQVWDLPGQINYLDPNFDPDNIFGGVGAMVWVLDAVDNYMEPIGRLTETILHLQDSYPFIKFTVFIHKIDSIADDSREDVIRDIMQRITDDLYDAGLENPPINYYGTSIYDHSIFEGFSRVMQGLVPQLPIFENLLNTIKDRCHFEKLYLFDVYSKIYIASDTTPIAGSAYELGSDFIDLIVDLSEVHGWHRGNTQDSKMKAQQSYIEECGFEVDFTPPVDPEVQLAESQVINFKGHHLYLREINVNLAFIGISKFGGFEDSKPVIDQNTQYFINSILKVLALARGDLEQT